MDTVNVRRAVALKAIVTEKLKRELQKEMQAAADELDERIRQMDMASKRVIADLQRTDLQRAMMLRQQIEGEKRRQEEIRDAALQRKEEVGQLELGSEYHRGVLEGTVELKVGDSLLQALAGVEIVVKDDTILEIRELPPEQIETQTARVALQQPDDDVSTLETG